MSWTPKYSNQLSHERNCGQHCVSMITHLPISMVSKFLKSNGGTSAKQVSGVLRWFGYFCDHSETKTRSLEGLPELCIIHIKDPKYRDGHWCIYFNGTIYDSCQGVYELKYGVLKPFGYRILGYIAVKKPT